jgi:DNA-nicking Smr family endonuclease
MNDDSTRAPDDQESVELQITDVLDLHSFLPQDISSVVREYLDIVKKRGLTRVRIIHGRGKGVQRKTVRTILERDPGVTAFGDAPIEAGGWGATWVELKNSTSRCERQPGR